MGRSLFWLRSGLMMCVPALSYLWGCASYETGPVSEPGSLCSLGESAPCACGGATDTHIQRCIDGRFGVCECHALRSGDAGANTLEPTGDGALVERTAESSTRDASATPPLDSGSLSLRSADDTCASRLAGDRTSELSFNATYLTALRFSHFRNDTSVTCGVATPGPDGVDSYIASSAGTMKVKVTAYQGVGMPVLSIRRGTGGCESLVERSCGTSPAGDAFESAFPVALKERVFIAWDTTGTSFTKFEYEVSFVP